MAKPMRDDVMNGGFTKLHDLNDTSKRNPPVQIMNHSLPIFWTPVAHLGETFMSFQRTNCGDQELDWIRCASRVGYRRATEFGECSKYYDDYVECFNRAKSVGRYSALQRERKKQQLNPIKSPPHDTIRLQHDIQD